ncbi:hypothetical protein [Bacillus cereus group sp. TH152-1LC]|uniref:hypothetical protein n=1 Tax=Bacillus cereus group sp. TH152-1LC TaxID=3018060 RepID=UPI0022DF9219|nr:hypothetical protein [Bacillus cereus group sp. TH152-1LC]MDA1675352.1 hypothetical protein [Bacillus cereus group sp. TH152-1LC]
MIKKHKVPTGSVIINEVIKKPETNNESYMHTIDDDTCNQMNEVLMQLRKEIHKKVIVQQINDNLISINGVLVKGNRYYYFESGDLVGMPAKEKIKRHRRLSGSVILPFDLF